MNTALLSILIMLALAVMLRIHVVISLFLGALIGGILSGVSLADIITTFQDGLSGGATIALSYGLLGVFSIALSHSGLSQLITKLLLFHHPKKYRDTPKIHIKSHYLILAIIALLGILSETIIPIHVAFVFIFIPPLMNFFNQLCLDRRAIACTICFGLITGYILFPIGFGNVYLNQILLKNLVIANLPVTHLSIFKTMLIPSLGMLIGLLIAVFFSYRKPKNYSNNFNLIAKVYPEHSEKRLSFCDVVISFIAILITLAAQIFYNSLLFGSLTGILVLFFGQVILIKNSDALFDQGFTMMATIGLVMITASGFSNFIKIEGNVDQLVQTFLEMLNYSTPFIVAILLLAGLFITLGLGSSFATVPILATIYVPICLQLGLSPMAIVALVGTAGALGDAGSPISDSTLAPSSVLNTDGQHDHLKDTVLPTFIHFNIPLLIFGWMTVMYLA